MNDRILAALAALGLIAFAPVFAGDEPKSTDAGKTAEAEKAPEPASSRTQHEVQIDGQTVKYTATAGWLIMKDDKGKPIARFGYTAYTRDGVKDLTRRPIMFAYNGGPGSSSIWLHMGILGPRRVVVNDQGFAPPPPSERVDNEFTVLDVTDLVMIDPVGTGFSKPLGDAKGADFWGVDQDIKSVGAFIKRYVSENGRWGSPKYLLGESYGGMRSAGLAYYLQSRLGMDLNGVVLVSPFLNAGSGIDGEEIDLPHVLYLPTFAATAWYHDAIPNKPASLQAYLDEVEHFAYNEYAPALMRGYLLPDNDKKAIAAKLAGYTGTSADYWEKADLRVSHPQFLQELKRNQRLVAGRIDSRFVGPAVNPLSETMDYDPFFPAVAPAYTAAFLDYLHTELKFGKDENYMVSAFDIEWDWKHKTPGEGGWMSPLPNTVPDLAMAMTFNPGLNVLVLQGYYDLATPYLATKNDLAHLHITPEARKRISIDYFDAGHMMYLHAPSMKKFRDDVAGFVRRTDRL
ncbi:MAG: carboxypeptidase [Gammaproteobacteria bacterium]|nr:carboxypeptidase [Gammaproteobacteria bacterium]